MSIVLITGGSRGLGASAALHAAERGLGVVVTYKSQPEGAAEVVARIHAGGGKARALELDVSDVASFPGFVETLRRTLHEGWGMSTLRGLVNNAGYGLYNAIESVTLAELDGLLGVHLKGPFFLTQALLPLFERGTSIVNVSSATTRVATAGVAPYAAAKGGLEVLTRYLAKELGARGIRANSVLPGAIRTELGGGLTKEFEALLAGQTALGRVGEPEDVGRVIASLLLDESGWINGQAIEISGGYQV